MSNRSKAGWRTLALVEQITLGWFISLGITFVAVPLGVLDILWQALTGRDGLSSSGMALGWVPRSMNWNTEQMIFGITGKGEFEPLP